jgi:uncharacterized membrane protein YeaQ/YmgE (transglycosylase-associated protein family)
MMSTQQPARALGLTLAGILGLWIALVPTGAAQAQSAAETAEQAARDAADAAGDAASAAGRAAGDAAQKGGSLLVAVLSWLVIGLVVGAVAKLLMPGPDGGGILLTSLLGIAGALLGGFVAAAIGFGSYAGPSFGGFVVAVLGAMLLLVLRRLLRRAS